MTKQYVHNMFDVVYMLEYLEGQSVVNKLSVCENEYSKKIENKFVKDPDGNTAPCNKCCQRFNRRRG